MILTKKFDRKYITIILFILFCSLYLVTDVFAEDNSTSLVVDDIPGITYVINSHKDEYPFYYVYSSSDGYYKIRFYSRVPSHFESASGSDIKTYGCGFFIFSNVNSDFQYINCKIKKSATSADSWTIGNAINCTSTQLCGLFCDYDDVLSISHDVSDSTGNVVFTPAPHNYRQIVGGITSEEIRETVLETMAYLAVLVISLVVLVLAFRKGWALLVTSLRGA